jgi:acetyltransferase-like isoleucine patch superfamily enzyme
MLGHNVIVHPTAQIDSNCLIGYGGNEPTEIGAGTIIRSGTVIYSGCSIGNYCMIGHNTILRDNTIIGDETKIGALVMCEGKTSIGKNCLINAQSHITRFAKIEDYVFFGANVLMANDNDITYMRQGHGENLKGAIIKESARLANGVKLLPNIIIGEHCFIGVGSVVTKNTERYSINVGVPSKKISERN